MPLASTMNFEPGFMKGDLPHARHQLPTRQGVKHIGQGLQAAWCLCRDAQGSPDGSDGKESACSAGDVGSIPGSGRSPLEKEM